MSARPPTPPPPSTPSRATRSSAAASAIQKSPITPEQVRRTEIARLKAKAIRAQHDEEAARRERASPALAASDSRPATKRAASTLRDARRPGADAGEGAPKRPHDEIQPVRKFAKYVDYDFSKMTDTKGGFLSAEDDRFNKALHGKADGGEAKPAHMTAQEWERHQLLRKLREARAGPFEPGLSSLAGKLGYDNEVEPARSECEQCGSLEIDWKWQQVFGRRVCGVCKDKFPERYSLLTKTEAKEDYLLTDPEMRDEELLPHLEKPNPHKATWNNMYLYLRCQVEEYAFSARKWGSPEALDEEFQKRERDKKKRKEDKFKQRLQDLKKRTRVEAYKRGQKSGGASNGEKAEFGARVPGRNEQHEHVWGRTLQRPDGTSVKTCVECNMEVEELEF